MNHGNSHYKTIYSLSKYISGRHQIYQQPADYTVYNTLGQENLIPNWANTESQLRFLHVDLGASTAIRDMNSEHASVTHITWCSRELDWQARVVYHLRSSDNVLDALTCWVSVPQPLCWTKWSGRQKKTRPFFPLRSHFFFSVLLAGTTDIAHTHGARTPSASQWLCGTCSHDYADYRSLLNCRVHMNPRVGGFICTVGK